MVGTCDGCGTELEGEIAPVVDGLPTKRIMELLDKAEDCTDHGLHKSAEIYLQIALARVQLDPWY